MAGNKCPHYSDEEIMKKFPLKECEKCPERQTSDDEEGLMFCKKMSDAV